MATPKFTLLVALTLLVLCVGSSTAGRLNHNEMMARVLSDTHEPVLPPAPAPAPGPTSQPDGTRWAVLVAGSAGYGNYRHQADVCHAYQILRKGGLKDENIVVFMYDDIANNEMNPRPGTIINNPQGGDVYAGVPKDYTGKQVTVNNLFAVILNNKTGLTGGSGKVLDTKPNDRIFIFYTDHGASGLLGMPSPPMLYANDFVEVLKTKHASGSYKEMVIYIESCESGSMVEGLLPEDINIYVTTASNATENSWGTYCPGMKPPPPPEFETCLGDMYSISWMEHSDLYDRSKLTVELQYLSVKNRTSQNNTYVYGSHVMEYGDKTISAQKLHLFQGYDPRGKDLPPSEVETYNTQSQREGVQQRDADIHFLWHKYKNSNDGSAVKTEVLKEMADEVRHRNHLDGSMKLIGTLLFGPHKANSILEFVRPAGSPLVDDWQCLKSMVRVFETYCGSLTQYGMKHSRALANLCNVGVSMPEMAEASMAACEGHEMGKYDPSKLGYSA